MSAQVSKGPLTRVTERKQAEVLASLRQSCIASGLAPEFAEDMAEFGLRSAVADFVRVYGRHALMDVVVDAADEAGACQ